MPPLIDLRGGESKPNEDFHLDYKDRDTHENESLPSIQDAGGSIE
jgi:hypothetical protein